MFGHKKENKNQQIPRKNGIVQVYGRSNDTQGKKEKKREEISLDAGNFLQKTVAIALLAHASER